MKEIKSKSRIKSRIKSKIKRKTSLRQKEKGGE